MIEHLIVLSELGDCQFLTYEVIRPRLYIYIYIYIYEKKVVEKWINRSTDNRFKNDITSLFQKDFIKLK